MDLYSLLPDIYSTIYEPDSWDDVLDKLSDRLGLVGSLIFSLDAQNVELNRAWNSRSMNGLLPSYRGLGYEEIDRQVMGALLENGTSDELLLCSHAYQKIIPKTKDLEKNYRQVISWLTEVRGIKVRAGAVLSKQASYWSMLSLQLPDTSEKQVIRIREKFEPLLPHISKAFEISRPFYVLKQRFNAVLDVLDKFRLGVGIIARSSEVILNNKYFSEIVDRNPGLGVKNLKVVSDQFKLNLNNLGDGREELLFHVSRDNKTPLQIHLSLTVCPYEKTAYAIAIITDPEFSTIVNIEAVSQAFKLSATEKRVSEHIISGLSNTEIAEENGCSSETVKTHVKSIFTKTGCKNRIELVNMAHKLSPPVENE